MKMQTPEQRHTISVRVNRDLLEEIRRAAALDSRSMHSFIIAATKRSIAELTATAPNTRPNQTAGTSPAAKAPPG